MSPEAIVTRDASSESEITVTRRDSDFTTENQHYHTLKKITHIETISTQKLLVNITNYYKETASNYYYIRRHIKYYVGHISVAYTTLSKSSWGSEYLFSLHYLHTCLVQLYGLVLLLQCMFFLYLP